MPHGVKPLSLDLKMFNFFCVSAILIFFVPSLGLQQMEAHMLLIFPAAY